MAERGIVMSGASVRAILVGTKTQTRRIVRLPTWASRDPEDIEMADDAGHDPAVICNHTGCFADLPLPYRVGDALWVRETWKPHSTFAGVTPRDIPQSTIFYRADDKYSPSNTPWRSPIHMPRWASRLTLAVTDVRVERLQDISEADAVAEGLACLSKDDGKTWKYGMADRDGWPGTDNDGWSWEDWYVDPRIAYARLWNSIHGPSAWDANPWVAVVTFERTTAQRQAAAAGDGGRQP